MDADNTAWFDMDNHSEVLKSICNFCPEVLGVVNVYSNATAEHVPHVKLRLRFMGDSVGDNPFSKAFTEPIPMLDEVNWLGKDTRCRFHPGMNAGRAKRYIADAVRKDLAYVSAERLYRLNRLGGYVIEGEPVFCVGGGLIRPPANHNDQADIKADSIPYNLDVDPNISEGEAIADILELISLFPNAGIILLTHNCLCLMRMLYETVWKSPRFCIFLHGLTGTMKTTVSSFLAQAYNRSKGIQSPPRLNASVAAAVAILYEMDDCVKVLDDLFPTDDSSIRRHQEEILIEITRVVGDGIEPARMRGHKIAKAPPTCGVVFTGEYLLGSGSTAARLLPVEMTPPDSAKLKEFQDKPLLISTFYYGFVKWIIENYSGVQALLKAWREAYNDVDLGVHARLQETHFFMNTAHAMLLQYCHERGSLSDTDANSMHLSYQNLLTFLIHEQDLRVKQTTNHEPIVVDYLKPIRDAYNSDSFILANSPKQFVSEIHDGLIHNECLCLRGDKLRELFPSTPLEEIADKLEAQGALRRSGKYRAIQIYGTKGKRFYAIKLHQLGGV